ncbi:hypothetical protein QTP86_024616 [Hemibagrus guttatus]|nr:hypothetical protein QTP86_024616 [Hemibagrus guttatus]
MEVEDLISAKFRTIIEALMIKTTSEIVKVFADVMLETRMEISRSWREINDLKEELEHREEQRDKQRADSNFRSQMTQVTFKTEDDDVVVSQENYMILGCTENRGEVQISEDATVEEMDTRQNSVSVLEQATTEMTTPVGQNGKTRGSQLKALSLIKMAKMKKLDMQTSRIKMLGDISYL